MNAVSLLGKGGPSGCDLDSQYLENRLLLLLLHGVQSPEATNNGTLDDEGPSRAPFLINVIANRWLNDLSAGPVSLFRYDIEQIVHPILSFSVFSDFPQDGLSQGCVSGSVKEADCSFGISYDC